MLKVSGGQPVNLVTTRSTVTSKWNRTDDLEFDVLVEGQKVGGAEALANPSPFNEYDDYYETSYAIPASLVRGKEQLEVRFQAGAGKRTGSIYELRIAKGR